LGFLCCFISRKKDESLSPSRLDRKGSIEFQPFKVRNRRTFDKNATTGQDNGFPQLVIMKSSGSLDLPSTEGVPIMIKAWKREERDLGIVGQCDA
jgi:hypothetical protein